MVSQEVIQILVFRVFILNGIRNIDVTIFFYLQIAFVQEQIQQSRSLDEALRHHLLQDECAINTELIQMEQRTPRYSPYRYPEREKLQRRMQSLRHEERQLVVQHHQRLSQLHDRLLELLNRHDQLAGWPERDVG